jgi:pimeloyl-ACP methyl ester carboxylesterase
MPPGFEGWSTMPKIALDDVELYYEEQGSGSPVLLIHGNGGIVELWEEVISGLAPSHRVIVPDRRGYRRSPAAFPRDIRVHATDAAALLEGLEAAPATVVGWSAGGVIALHLAIARPDVVSSLVLLEPAVIARRPSAALARSLLRWEAQRLRGRREDGALTFFRWASRYTSGGNAFDAYPAEWRRLMIANAPVVFAENWAGAGGERLRRRQLGRIACPVMLLTGDRTDPAFATGVSHVQKLLPHATVRTIPGAGHMIPTDAPGEVIAAVRAATGVPAMAV